MNVRLSAIILEPTRPDLGARVEILKEDDLEDALSDLAASLVNEYPTTRAEHRRVVTMQIEFIPDQPVAEADMRAGILQRLAKSGIAQTRACALAMEAFNEATLDATEIRTVGR